MRSCSVCGVEIDKTTAYTKAGEQKPQGRRCINCVDGAVTPKAEVETPTTEPTPTVTPSVSKPGTFDTPAQTEPAPRAEPTEDASEGTSNTTYIIAAVIVIAVVVLIFG